MQSRFMRNNINPTIMVLASSKRTEQSFLETWIENKKKNDSKTTIIIDEPQWVIREDKRSDRTFKVAVGNKFLPTEVLPLDITEEECLYYREKGFKIIDVPIGYYENFLDDVDIALTDIAGISTTSMSSYISGERLTEAKTEAFENPFTKDIIEVGDGQDDLAQYSDWFDLEKVDKSMKSKPLYIGLDLSLDGDKSGIAGVWIKGKKPPKEGVQESNELYYQLAFVVSVKAPRGHQVSFEKTRNFIYWLKSQGFKIKGVTSDTYARAGVEQDLLAKGFDYSTLSVDRVNASRIQEQYAYLKNCIYEKRLALPRRGINLLTEELIGLQRNNNSGKIDHTPQGINSKDSADAMCQAVWNASLHADEFAYDYGESLETFAKFNEALNVNDEETLTQLLKESLKPKYSASDIEYYNAGLSIPEDIIGAEVSDGVMLW